jgi:hypothetical protein
MEGIVRDGQTVLSERDVFLIEVEGSCEVVILANLNSKLSCKKLLKHTEKEDVVG